MKNLKTDVLAHLAQRHQELLKFWTEGAKRPNASIENHCDMVYSLFLLGELDNISAEAVSSFCDLTREARLPGWRTHQSQQIRISVHNCAYVFGALNILRSRFAGLYARVLDGRTFHLPELANPETLLPVFSTKWAHHNWRVSHWLGGVPSIFLSLESNVPDLLPETGLALRCRNAVSALMDPHTGLIRAYRSALLQKLFRLAYGIRHSPDLGDIGGVAHILWIDHVMNRPYIAAKAIREESSRLLLANRPFMETVPYCLDFDIIQALRTAISQTSPATQAEIERSLELMKSIEEFFKSPKETYTLHKVPGALATYNECMLLINEARPPSATGNPADIIKEAFWL